MAQQPHKKMMVFVAFAYLLMAMFMERGLQVEGTSCGSDSTLLAFCPGPKQCSIIDAIVKDVGKGISFNSSFQ